jgi:hypothetical protein
VREMGSTTHRLTWMPAWLSELTALDPTVQWLPDGSIRAETTP